MPLTVMAQLISADIKFGDISDSRFPTKLLKDCAK